MFSVYYVTYVPGLYRAGAAGTGLSIQQRCRGSGSADPAPPLPPGPRRKTEDAPHYWDLSPSGSAGTPAQIPSIRGP